MGCKYSRFRVLSKREKCPPRVETAAGKRQTREMSGHVTLSVVRGKKYAVLNLSNGSAILRDNPSKILSADCLVWKVREFQELPNNEIKMVGYWISFSDNLQKLKMGGRFCGPCTLPW